MNSIFFEMTYVKTDNKKIHDNAPTALARSFCAHSESAVVTGHPSIDSERRALALGSSCHRVAVALVPHAVAVENQTHDATLWR